MGDLAGFWSYAHDDDKNSGGRILSLSERLEEGFQLLSGESLRLFIDRDIQWGEEWERRIDEALQQTTFFIPIITPSYFQHEACRKELLQFASAAKQFGVEQLLMPVYYVTVSELESDETPSDEAMAIIKGTQWADGRDVRLKDEAAADHRAFVDGLSARLVGIAAETDAQPSQAPVEPATLASPAPGTTPPTGESEEEGQLELLAKGEAALPEWVKTVEAISAELQEFGRLTGDAVAEMGSDEASGSFAARLAAANRFAGRIEEPADNLVQLGSDYVSQLFEVDPAVRTLLRLARETDGTDSSSELIDLLRSIRSLAGTSRDSMQNAKELSEVLNANAGFSRELRRPLKRIEGALRNMVDAQVILDEWNDEIDDILGEDEP